MNIKKNILISSSRSGTNYFLSILEIFLDNPCVLKEIFRDSGDSKQLVSELLGYEYVGEYNLDFWNKVCFAANEREYNNIVAKIFYYHRAEDNDLWNTFDSDHQIIHLIRGNLFDSYLSLKLAEQSGEWQKKGSDVSKKLVSKILIDRVDAINFIKRRTVEIERIREQKKELVNYQEIFYEDISGSLSDCVQVMSNIYNKKINVDGVHLTQKKQKVLPNNELVENYSDVADLDFFSILRR